jgi:hypothetical protein
MGTIQKLSSKPTSSHTVSIPKYDGSHQLDYIMDVKKDYSVNLLSRQKENLKHISTITSSQLKGFAESVFFATLQ